MTIKIWFDGLCEPFNPRGYGTYGFVVKRDGKTLKKGKGYIGKGKGITNNVAEYTALIEALKYVAENHSDSRILCVGDSKLVVNQITGRFRVKSYNLKPLRRRAVELAKNLDITFKWVPREQNEEADSLSREVYESKAFKDRKERARKENMKIEKIGENKYKVKGRYTVNLEEGTCTCPDYKHRGAKCKHIFKVEMELWS